MRHRVPPAQLPPRPAEEPPPEHLLSGLSNQSVARLLARAPKPDPQRTKVLHIDSLGGAEEWADTLNKKQSVIPLYAELATQLGATVIRDVPGTDEKDITRALTPDRVQPGLNFVSRGLGKGRCWYIEDGKPVNALTVTAKGPLPKVAIGLAPALHPVDGHLAVRGVLDLVAQRRQRERLVARDEDRPREADRDLRQRALRRHGELVDGLAVLDQVGPPLAEPA